MLWDRARMEESVNQDGKAPWNEIKEFALPAYPDPTSPPAFNFTANTATYDANYYRVVFLDSDDAEQPTAPVYSAGIRPSAADIREWSQVDFDGLGWEIDDGVDPLDRLTNASLDWIRLNTGLELTHDLDPKYISAYQDAARLLVEWTAIRMQPDFIEDNADFDLIKSFTAGEYSEERRGLLEAGLVLHPYPPLNQLLGFLTTGGMGGNSEQTPAVGWQEFDLERAGRYTIDSGRPGVYAHSHDMRDGGLAVTGGWVGGYWIV